MGCLRWIAGVIVLLFLIPILLPAVVAVLPWWVQLTLLATFLLIVVWIIGFTLRLFGIVPNSRRHNHFYRDHDRSDW